MAIRAEFRKLRRELRNLHIEMLRLDWELLEFRARFEPPQKPPKQRPQVPNPDLPQTEAVLACVRIITAGLASLPLHRRPGSPLFKAVPLP